MLLGVGFTHTENINHNIALISPLFKKLKKSIFSNMPAVFYLISFVTNGYTEMYRRDKRSGDEKLPNKPSHRFSSEMNLNDW